MLSLKCRILIIFIILTLCRWVNVSAIEIDGVPLVRQTEQYCGPAALSSAMSFYGVNVDQQAIGKVVYQAKFGGALITDLENYARSQGFQTKLAQGTFDELKGFIDQKRPVVGPHP